MTRISAQVIGLAIVAGVTASSLIAQPEYSLTNVSPLQVFAVNANGTTVGSVHVASNTDHAFIRSEKGVVTDIGTLGGPVARAMAINNSGLVVGESALAGSPGSRAFMYWKGEMKNLGLLGTTDPDAVGFSSAAGVNASGDVVGGSQRTGPGGQARAFLYSHGAMTDLGTLPGALVSGATAINDHGEIVGASGPVGLSDNPAIHAFLYTTKTGMVDLGSISLDGSDTQSVANAINNKGEIVGRSNTGVVPGEVAFLYRDGVMTDIGGFGGMETIAYAINDHSDIVGTSQTVESEDRCSPMQRAFIYRDGVMRDLNDLSAPQEPPVLLLWAVGINNAGVIIATGIVGDCLGGGPLQDFILTPIGK